MADNFTANPGAGGTNFASDDVGGIHHPRVKIEHGADGAAVDASTATPLPTASHSESSSMSVASLPVVPKFAAIVASISGVTAVVAAVGGKKIRVVSYVFVSADQNNIKFQSGGADVTGVMTCGVGSGVVAPFSPVGHFETAVNTNLNINLSAAFVVGGHLTYIEV